MNSRDLSELTVRLKTVLGITGDIGLNTVAKKLEMAIADPDGLALFDKKTTADFQNSRDDKGHYAISAGDNDVIKHTKSVINLLRSLENITPSILQQLAKFVAEEAAYKSWWNFSKLAKNAVAGLAKDYVAGIYNFEEKVVLSDLNTFINDISEFQFYTGQLVSAIPDLTGIDEQVQKTLSEVQTVLVQSSIGDTVNAIMKRPELEYAINAIIAAANKGISAEEKSKYFDEKESSYQIPDGISGHTQNLMFISNVGFRADLALNRVNRFCKTWTDTEKFPLGQVTDMLGLLKEMGQILADFKKFDIESLDAAIKDDFNKAMKDILGKLSPTILQLASIAHESELRLGLQDNALISKFKTISDTFESLSVNYGTKISMRYPYREEKKSIIDKIEKTANQNMKMLDEAANEIRNRSSPLLDGKQLSLTDLQILSENVKKIGTPAGSYYQAALQIMINEVTGLDKVLAKIKECESVIDKHTGGRLNILEAAVSKTLGNTMWGDAFSTINLRENLDEVRELYKIRDTLTSMISEADSKKDDATFKPELQHFNPKSGNLEKGSAKAVIPKNIENLFLNTGVDANRLIDRERENISKLGALSTKTEKAARLGAVGQGNMDVKGMTIRGGQQASKDRHQYQASISKISSAAHAKDPSANTEKERSNAEIIQAIKDEKKGAIILKCESAREALVQTAGDKLIDSQAELLNQENKRNGLYKSDKNDGIIVVNVKQMHNVLVRSESLMESLNDLTNILASGGLSYTKILPLLPTLKNNAHALIEQLHQANTSLALLGTTPLSGEALEAVRNTLSSAFATISNSIPTQLKELGTNLQTEMLTKMDPEYAAMFNKLVDMSSKLINNVTFVISGPSNPAPNAQVEAKNNITSASTPENASPRTEEKNQISIVVAVIKSISDKLDEQRSIAKKSKSTDKSYEKQLDGLLNTISKLKKSFDGTVKMSEGNNITGFLKFSANMLAAYKELQKSSPDLLELLKPQIQELLLKIEPIFANGYALAAVTEKALEMKSGTITASLASTLSTFKDFAHDYEATLTKNPPYYKEQLKIAVAEEARLREQLKDPSANQEFIKTQIYKTQSMIDTLAKQSLMSPSPRNDEARPTQQRRLSS